MLEALIAIQPIWTFLRMPNRMAATVATIMPMMTENMALSAVNFISRKTKIVSQKTPTETPSSPAGEQSATSETSATETSSTAAADPTGSSESEKKDAA